MSSSSIILLDDNEKKIGELLQEKGLISSENLQKALSIQKKTKAKIGQILIKQGYISENDLLYHIALQYQLEYLDKIDVVNIEELVKKTPLKFVQRYKIVPFSLEDKTIKIALLDPTQLHPLDEFRMLWIGYNIITVLSGESQILRLIHDHYEFNEREQNTTEAGDLSDEFGFIEDTQDLQNSLDLANEAPIIKMVNVILTNAVNSRASDIHIEPQEKSFWVRYRIDGIMRKVLTPPKSIQNGILSRIKIMANLNIAENRLPQDGRIKIRTGGKDIDIRVSSLPTQFGERIVMRILNKTDANYELEKIGMDTEIYNVYKNLIQNPNGIILITGPTGSGKTSTLYASLNILNQESCNIITVEDPIEYQMEGINQVQAKSEIGLTFAEGLRSILRQDPDVIMVGEIRDQETARIAIQASLTGHLVFSTLHTNDAPSAVNRLLDMGIEPYLITSTCLGFMAQRLVRALCPHCKIKTTVKSTELIKMGLKKLPKGQASFPIFKEKGCGECFETGYKGRIGIYEFMLMDNDLRSMVLNNPSLDDLKIAANKKGMITLRESGLKKVLSGVTSIEEVMRVT